ncbi:ABC transporter permease [Metabacillus malikii]|uniref:ABC-2 type transport system permease protein n=1 Tax=Metabacillus malikii TaxID=1504265 RepID=A0ABT9ZEA2_9BACI|nr:ABC transporter permease [Metabacillus malikii]MDQ0229893.1 ABC-2 type transport system permease protein [Metabacillus malikii]
MINLIKNEHMKLYAKKSTWIMLVILVVVIIGTGIIQKTLFDEDIKYGDDWKEQLQEETTQLQKEAEEDGFYNEQIDLNQYYLDHNIKPVSYDGWQFILSYRNLTALLSLFTIIVAAGIVSTEFNLGTIKLLLIRPATRSKILLSKYVTFVIFALELLVLLFVISLLTGSLLYGLHSIDTEIILLKTESFEKVSVLNEIVKGYGFSFVNLVIMSTFAFMISTLFRNSGMAIGLSIFLMFAGNTIVGIFAEKAWAKYILFANDLEQYLYGEPLVEGITLEFSIVILIVYYIVFLAITWVSFLKRDVLAN